MKKLMGVFASIAFLISCGGGSSESVLLLGPPDESEFSPGNITFIWDIENRSGGAVYCSDVITDKGPNPYDGWYENRFHAGTATDLMVDLSGPSSVSSRFDWGVEVFACDKSDAVCQDAIPPCKGDVLRGGVGVFTIKNWGE